MATKKKEIPIILCAGTHGRCVVYGYTNEEPAVGEPVVLRRARMILSWSGGGGLFGVAVQGPRDGTRITHAVPTTCETVWQEWVECTAEAAKELDEWPAA